MITLEELLASGAVPVSVEEMKASGLDVATDDLVDDEPLIEVGAQNG